MYITGLLVNKKEVMAIFCASLVRTAPVRADLPCSRLLCSEQVRRIRVGLLVTTSLCRFLHFLDAAVYGFQSLI
jgi:hypothetical protein